MDRERIKVRHPLDGKVGEIEARCYECRKCNMDRHYIFTCTLTGAEDATGDGWCEEFEWHQQTLDCKVD